MLFIAKHTQLKPVLKDWF